MKSTKTVLIFCDWYRPGFKAGGPITSNLNLVENLGDDISIKLVCGDRDYLSSVPYPNVAPDKWSKVGKAKVMYLSLEKQTKEQIKQIVSTEKPGTIYINGLFSPVFSLYPLIAANKSRAKIIVAPRGMLALGALSIKPRKKKLFLIVAKLMGWYRKVHFHVTSSEEAEQVQSILGGRNGYTEIANLPAAVQPKLGGKAKEKNALRILSATRIAREKNTLFAIHCLSKVPPHLRVKAKFVGEVYDKDYFAECKAEVARLPQNVEVEFAGVIHPDELPALYTEVDLFFLPTLGENYGHAIAEALLCNTPVLISDKTPWRNLKADGMGADLSLNNPKAFVEFISKVAEMDFETYANQYGSVSQSVESRINRQEIRDAYLRLLS